MSSRCSATSAVWASLTLFRPLLESEEVEKHNELKTWNLQSGSGLKSLGRDTLTLFICQHVMKRELTGCHLECRKEFLGDIKSLG